MKSKAKCLIAVFSAILILATAVLGVTGAFGTEGPVLLYTFENDAAQVPDMFGNAACIYDSAKNSKVLRLDGTDGTYAEIPQGFFDGMDVMTVSFDILVNTNAWNHFAFTIGLNNQTYDFFRIRNNEVRNAITVNSWGAEAETKCETDCSTQTWMNIAIVFNGTQQKLYVNGTLASENSDTGLAISDLGTNLISYFGKSFYDDDYFNGSIDNFAVYDRVLSASEISTISDNNLSEIPDIYYSFESGCNYAPDYYGNAAVTYDSDKGSNVLYLDGTDGTYAQMPTGYFDGKDTMTVLMDIKPGGSGGNYFTFAFGQNSTYYDFLRIRGIEVRNAMTVGSYYGDNEKEVKASLDYSSAWLQVALVFNGTNHKLYVNGKLVSENQNTGITVSDLGSNLLGYIGKSFYDGDSYFKGYFDNIEVYNSVLSEESIKSRAINNLPLLLDVTVGSIESDFESLSGTDNHTAVKTVLDRTAGEISSIIQKRENVTRTPVKIHILSDDCRIYVDGVEKSADCYVDLTADRQLKIVCGDITEEYTLKAAQTAANPILPGQYADPDIDVLDGKFWIYPTTDGVAGWGGTQFHAFSSPDLVNWTDEGVILDVLDKNPSVNANGVQIAASPWSRGNAWAPAIEEKDGRYYFYYCGRILEELESTYGEGMAIGVASADNPQGPYTASSAPILYPKMLSDANIGFAGQVIDPSVFTDSDGTSYLLFGNGNAAMATLNSDMITVKTSTLRMITGIDEFRESIAVFKRENSYYFTWSCDDTGSENYHVRYGVASSLTGTITNKGILLQKDTSTGILATAHQSVIYLSDCDRCFIAYHRFYTPISQSGCVGHHRETCIDEITFTNKIFSADEMNKVTPSYSGPGAVDINGNNLTETTTYPTCDTDGYITAKYSNGSTAFVIDATQNSKLKAYGHQLRCTRISGTSKFLISCENCNLSREVEIGELMHCKNADEILGTMLDKNGDGFINIRDYSILINE